MNRDLLRGVRPFLVVLAESLLAVVFSLPRFRGLNWLKALLLSAMGARIGRRCIFYPGVWIMPGRGLSVGDDVDFALGVIVTTGGGVEIGNRVLIGYRTQILSTNHRIPEGTSRIFDAGHVGDNVRIANDVWIGANCIILPGVSIGEGAVVAAGSVVTGDVEPFAVVAGVPARIIRHRILAANAERV
jgi:acetyltransferase-like isoleucine patch superfamily enzyme